MKPADVNIVPIVVAWQRAKAAELKAVDQRRKAEDDLIEALKLSKNEEGTQNVKREGFAIKVTNRFNRKVDGDKLQALALEAGIDHDVLQGLFRWKPELSLTAWKAASPTITSALADAITTTAGRPSVAIETLLKD